MVKRYFAYSTDHGFERFVTAEEAEQFAQNLLDDYRDDSYDEGWSEDVESVCWGEVSQQVTEVVTGPAANPANGSYSYDYILKGDLNNKAP